MQRLFWVSGSEKNRVDGSKTETRGGPGGGTGLITSAGVNEIPVAIRGAEEVIRMSAEIKVTTRVVSDDSDGNVVSNKRTLAYAIVTKCFLSLTCYL